MMEPEAAVAAPAELCAGDLDRCRAALARLLEERRLLGNVLNALHHETMSLDDADALRACGGASVRTAALEHATAAAATELLILRAGSARVAALGRHLLGSLVLGGVCLLRASQARYVGHDD